MLGGLQRDCLLLLLFPQLILKKKTASNRSLKYRLFYSACAVPVTAAYRWCYRRVWLVPPGIQLVQQEKKQPKVSSAKRARRRWQLLYTLVNNPSLVGTRKHFQLQTAESFVNGSLHHGSVKEASTKEEMTKEAEACADNWSVNGTSKRRKCLCPSSLLTWGASSQISALTVHRHMYGCLISLEIVCPLSCFSSPPPPPHAGRLYFRATVWWEFTCGSGILEHSVYVWDGVTQLQHLNPSENHICFPIFPYRQTVQVMQV